MPIRRITLTPELNEFVETMVNTGEYRRASDVVSHGLRLLEQRWDGAHRKLTVLRAAIETGINALECGDFVDLADAELDGYLERLPAHSTTAN